MSIAALGVIVGAVSGCAMQRYRHIECIRFLNAAEREVGRQVDALGAQRL